MKTNPSTGSDDPGFLPRGRSHRSRVAAIVAVFISYSTTWAASTFVGSVWSGGVTSTSVTVAVRLDQSGQQVRLRVSTDLSLSSPIYSSSVTTSLNTGNSIKMVVQGLVPDTDYFYGVEVAGILRNENESRGRFRTFPLGRSSFKIAFAGDSDFRAKDQRAFDAIAAERPLVFIHLGDLHYSDTNSVAIGDYRENYDGVLRQENQAALFRRVPLAYIWGDHDFCGDNSNGLSVGRDAARSAYRERVPHYQLGSTGGTLGQAFTIGRVRVIMTDNRSASASADARESSSKSRLGTAQKIWFQQELISARDAGFPLLLWVNSDPWISPASIGSDTWGGYATERTEIANFIRDNRIVNLAVLSADMHALAFDDGTNSDYAVGGGAPLTVMHAASLTAEPSTKGGPYTVGPFPGSQQYGILEIYDSGGTSIACRFRGMQVGTTEPRISRIFSSSTAGSVDHTLTNISSLARITRATDVIVSGFVISGTEKRSVLLRAIGPTLEAFGVSDPLTNPVLSVFQDGRLIASNRRWAENGRDIESTSSTFDRAGAFRLTNNTSNDAALVLSLDPGAYSVQVQSAGDQTGTVLIEVYHVP